MLLSSKLSSRYASIHQDNILLLVLSGLFLLPIWLFKYLPLQDGPIHVYTADILQGFLTGHQSIFQDYYITNLQLAPNWTTQAILTGLMFWVSPILAEKLLLSIYVILLPFAFRYALNAVRPDTSAAPFLMFLAFPFCYNLTFNMGFYNFAYSLIVFFFAIGYWLRHRSQLRLAQTGVLLLLVLGLYFTHLFSFVIFAIVVGVLNLSSGLGILTTARRAAFLPLKQLFIKTTLPTLLTLLPASLICLHFLSQNSTGSTGPKWSGSTLENLRLGSLLTLSSLVSYNSLEIFLATAIVLLLVGLSGYRLIQNKHLIQKKNALQLIEGLKGVDGLLVVTLVLLGVYLFSPRALSGSVTIKDRVLLYPFLTLILWLTAADYSRSLRQRIKWLLVSISSMLLIVQMATYAYISDYFAEYISTAPLIEPNSTLLAINFPTPREAAMRADGEPNLWRPPEFVRPWQINTFINASGYVAVARQAVLLNNYQGNEDYFPINFRPELNPFTILETDDWQLGRRPSVNILGYTEMTGRPIDYVTIWRTSDYPLQEEGAQAIFQQLFSAYDRIYTSPQRGYAQLYRRKGLSAKAAS
ncbi:MAG: hypothetical protein AAF152_18815 [Cyanobacteria bacterium P01_A01_bin.114]